MPTNKDKDLEEENIYDTLLNLKSLGKKLKIENPQFTDKDQLLVQELANIVKDLYEEYVKVKEALETETINASSMRYQLHYLPIQMGNERRKAITAARLANEESLSGLKNHLEGIDNNIDHMKTKLVSVERMNSKMQPEREKNKSLYNDFVGKLNRVMSDKANQQIMLNETRDNLREAKQTIADLEENLVLLQQDMVEERKDVKIDKRNLKKEIDETKLKTKAQEKKNEETQKELSEILKVLNEKQSRLTSKKRSIEAAEKSCQDLKAKENILTYELERLREDNEKLRQIGVTITQEELQTELSHAEEKGKMEKTLKEIQSRYTTTNEDNARFSTANKELTLDVETTESESSEKREELKALVDDLKEHEIELSNLTEAIGKIHKENLNLESEINSIEEAHEDDVNDQVGLTFFDDGTLAMMGRAQVQILNKEIVDLKEKMEDQKSQRLEFQGQLDAIHQQLEIIKSNHAQYMSKMNKQINEGKKDHAKYTKEGQDLQKSLKEAELKIRSNQELLKKRKEDYKKMRDDLEREVKHLEKSIEKMTTSIEEKNGKVNHDTPIYIKLKETEKELEEIFAKKKKQIMGLKNKKADLSSEYTKLKDDIERLEKPKNELEEKIKVLRVTTMKDLKKHAQNRYDNEIDIQETSRRLLSVIDANNRLIASNEDSNAYIDELNADIINTGEEITNLRNGEYNFREVLEQGWIENLEETKSAEVNDVNLLHDVEKVELVVTDRVQQIGCLTDSLYDELVQMTKFLNAVSALRIPIEAENSAKFSNISETNAVQSLGVINIEDLNSPITIPEHNSGENSENTLLPVLLEEPESERSQIAIT